MLFFDQVLLYIREFIAAIGVIVITVGAAKSVYHLVLFAIQGNVALNTIRLQFGNSVILGLEFMVGADIVGSLVQPDYYNLGLLVILVLIRTILSFFLDIELQALTPSQRHAIK